MPRVICAWCGAALGEAVGCSGDSHGICKECMARELAKLDEEDRKDEMAIGSASIYAICLADLQGNQIDRQMARALVAPVMGEVIDIRGDNWATVGITLDCDNERATAIVAILRKNITRNGLRIWRYEKNGWRSI